MKWSIGMLAIALFCVVMSTLAHAQDDDLAISNGRVMDPETEYDAIANVGNKAGRNVVITKEKITGTSMPRVWWWPPVLSTCTNTAWNPMSIA